MKFLKNNNAHKQIMEKLQNALEQTAHVIKEDLTASGTMPMASGRLQNKATYVDTKKLKQNTAAIVSDTVYARRKYFNPGFNFDRRVNSKAEAGWFAPYVVGSKKNMVRDVFVRKIGARG